MFLISAVLLLAQFLALGSAVDLEAVTVETKLPKPLLYINAVFDEVDSIYLLGGYSSAGHTYQIYKYSVTQETLEAVGRLPLVSIGNAVWLGNETIAYFGGISSSNEIQSTIWKTSTTQLGTWSEVGDLPYGYYLGTSVWDLQENAYTFEDYEVSKYDVGTHSTKVVAQISTRLVAASSIWDSGNEVAFVFGGRSSRTNILKFDPVDDSISLVFTSPARISEFCAVWTGEAAYVIALGSFPSLLRFDPSTNQVTQIPVNNFSSYLEYTGCTYVKSLNRMYIFGGYDYDQGLYSDSIIYIDLNDAPITPSTTEPSATTTATTTEPPATTTEPPATTTEPPATTTEQLMTTTTVKPPLPKDCRDLEDWTLVPNPFCCESFYQCYDGQPIRYECKDELQFNPATLKCEDPEIVGCFTSFRSSIN